MRGHHSPLGWAVTVLIAVACAHVLLELAGAVLVVAVALRLLALPARDVLSHRANRCPLFDRSRRQAVVVERVQPSAPDRRRGDRSS